MKGFSRSLDLVSGSMLTLRNEQFFANTVTIACLWIAGDVLPFHTFVFIAGALDTKGCQGIHWPFVSLSYRTGHNV